jgi:hypothetical protein
VYEQISSFLGDMTGTAHSYDDDEKWRCDWEKANPNNRRMNCRGNSIQVHGIRMRTSHGSRLGGDDLSVESSNKNVKS